MMDIRNTLLAALATGSLVVTMPAQIGGASPEEAVRKILEEVSTEMQEIDRLLLESSRESGGGAADAIRRNAENIKKLLEETRNSQGKVVRGIDRLIEELQNMAQQSQNQSGNPQDQDGEPQDGQQPRDGQQPGQRPQGERQQTQTPDMVEQGEEQRPANSDPAAGQDPTPQDNSRDPQRPGENTDRGSPIEDGTEQVRRASDVNEWGKLPDYAQFLHNRGGAPAVPPKYRRLYEAFQKRSQKKR